MASQILCIDIQSDLLTAVLFVGETNKDIIASAAVTTRDKSVEEVIGELTSVIDCDDCRCYLSLGASFFSFRNLSLPFSDRKSINKILPLELGESTVDAIDTMIIDAMINKQETGTESEIITAMISKEVLAEYHAALKEAGLHPEFITLSGLPAIAEILQTVYAPQDFIFLSLRLDSSNLYLVSEGALQLVRPLPFTPLPFGAGPVAEFIADKDTGKLQVTGLENSGESYLEFARAVKQTLAPLSLPEGIPIYIDGTAGTTKGVSSWLETKEAFARPCLVCGRPGLLPLPIHLPEQTKKHAAFLTTCLSMGQQTAKVKDYFNFAKNEFAGKSNLAEYRGKAKIVGMALLALLVFSFGYLWVNNTGLKRQQAALVASIYEVFKKAQPDVHRIVAPVQQLQVVVDNTKASTGDGTGSVLPQTVLHVLRELSTRIPASTDVRLIRMVYESKGLRLIGITNSFNTVDTIKKNLKQSPAFSSVIISSTKQTPKDNKIRFEMKLDVRSGKK